MVRKTGCHESGLSKQEMYIGCRRAGMYSVGPSTCMRSIICVAPEAHFQ